MPEKLTDEIAEITEEELEKEIEEEEIPVSYTAWTYNDEAVNCYLRSIAKIPLLTLEEEKILTWKIWEAQKRITELEDKKSKKSDRITRQRGRPNNPRRPSRGNWFLRRKN